MYIYGTYFSWLCKHMYCLLCNMYSERIMFTEEVTDTFFNNLCEFFFLFICIHKTYLTSHSVGFLGEIAGCISKRIFSKYLGKHVIKKNGIYVNIYNNIINCLHVFECQNAKNAKNCQLIITQQRAVSKNNPPTI